MARKIKPLIDRLGEKLKAMPNGCWEWQGCCTWDGYGRIGYGMRNEGQTTTHRAMWEIVFGSIPKNLCVLHKCDNRSCANPAHLFLGTNATNTADMIAKGRSPKGGDHGIKGEENRNSKLTWGKIRSIRNDNRSQSKIAIDYGISSSHVHRIKNYKQWKE